MSLILNSFNKLLKKNHNFSKKHMKNTVYSLKSKKGTEELHLFKASMILENKCKSEKESVCKKWN